MQVAMENNLAETAFVELLSSEESTEELTRKVLGECISWIPLNAVKLKHPGSQESP